MPMMTKADLRNEVKRLDPSLAGCSDTFKTAMLLLALLVVGPKAANLRAFTRFSSLFIRLRLERLRENGVVIGDRLACEWDEPKAGAVAFWLDVNVAQGLLRRQLVPASR